MIYWFFGLPGSGKTYLAKKFSRLAGIPQFEGDEFHTEEDRRVIAVGQFTLAHRHAQLTRIDEALQGITGHAIVTHPLPDKESRERVRSSGNTRLVYVKASLRLVKSRLVRRKEHHFGPELLDAWIDRHWQEPEEEECFALNNSRNAPAVERRLRALLVA